MRLGSNVLADAGVFRKKGQKLKNASSQILQ
jgi:hypothetical protein